MQAASFGDVVFALPHVAGLVFAYQRGLYEDVRDRFRDYEGLVELHGTGDRYMLDVAFSTSLARAPAALSTWRLCLRANKKRDPRFPLHVAVCEGDARATLRILACRRDLASAGAIVAALLHDRLDIAELLLDLRASALPELWSNPSRIPFFELLPDLALPFAQRDDPTALALFLRLRDDAWPRDLVRDVLRSGHAHSVAHVLQHVPYAAWRNDIAASSLRLKPYLAQLDLRSGRASPLTLDRAAASGYLDVVEMLLAQAPANSTVQRALELAAANGHRRVVECLYARGASSVQALDAAVANGHVLVARFLLVHHVDGASCSAMDRAAANGHTAMLLALDALGVLRWTHAALESAVVNGHDDVVSFLLAHSGWQGCQRDSVLVARAIEAGRARLAATLLASGLPFPNPARFSLSRSLRGREALDMLTLLLSHNVPLTVAVMDDACASGNLALVMQLHVHSTAGCTHRALEKAAHAQAWPIVHFLLDHRKEGGTPRTVQIALQHDRVDVLTRLLRTQPHLFSDKLVRSALESEAPLASTALLLEAGFGTPRALLLRYGGRRHTVTRSKMLLPYCMHASDAYGNLTFLLKLVLQPSHHRPTILNLISHEVEVQGWAVANAVTNFDDRALAARLKRLLVSGDRIDWALGLAVIGQHTLARKTHPHAAWMDHVKDPELRTLL
ncbi:hypothetical protein SDRG_08566 [Saprolegnia diclina VS20]|uniref:Ankyrin repeat domain-containing protein n=1 Tax=Saprolegnia diclina (strain VS20) TaxID=1156394 RepID=T0QJF7_SAPDV|nr:hypothetical protein SDRG_08566 [Saprolegnia diclina VS20]EQC33885.1 hypothetical protein SDRG_08566 [Saprolegnia diclina VS20]|eukprot:XP_008612680.1 hypothetical protein SDRG_08566 [Saprolegnia diclina VS20]